MNTDLKKLHLMLNDYEWPTEEEYMKDTEAFTVLLPVYGKDEVEFLTLSIKSVIANTVTPSEILIMQDGPVGSELELFLEKLFEKYPNVVRLVKSSKNKGLGPNLANGVKVAKNELIGRMDADDIASLNRFRLQLEKFNQNTSLDIVGGNIIEFDEKYQLKSVRSVPETQEEIYHFAKMRSPFNHPAVMYKKEAVLSVGNYGTIRSLEDYDLFSKLLIANKQCENIAENIVYMRAPNEMYNRRGGKYYFKRYVSFRKMLLNKGFISKKDFIISVFVLFVTSYAPTFIRKIVYGVFLRK